MKHNVRKVCALALSVVLCLAVLAGCGSSFSATELVKGNLDLIYLNQYSDTYLKSVNLTKDEANQQYEDGIAVEVDYFCNYFNVVLDSCDETIQPQIADMYRQIYDHSKFEVGGETRNGDTYLVELTVYPIDIFQKFVEEDWETYLTQWQERYLAGEFASEQEAETNWAQGLIDQINGRMDSIGYLDPQTVSVQVTKGDDGRYSIDNNDFSRIDGLMIAY